MAAPVEIADPLTCHLCPPDKARTYKRQVGLNRHIRERHCREMAEEIVEELVEEGEPSAKKARTSGKHKFNCSCAMISKMSGYHFCIFPLYISLTMFIIV